MFLTCFLFRFPQQGNYIVFRLRDCTDGQQDPYPALPHHARAFAIQGIMGLIKAIPIHNYHRHIRKASRRPIHPMKSYLLQSSLLRRLSVFRAHPLMYPAYAPRDKASPSPREWSVPPDGCPSILSEKAGAHFCQPVSYAMSYRMVPRSRCP